MWRVDGLLHIYADGAEVPGSPFFSNNGPITAPLSPSLAELDATLNFEVLPPISDDVDFVVELNPGHLVVESDYSNNVGSLLNQSFKCRDVVELGVRADQRHARRRCAAGLDDAPGMGDNFLRGIYSAGEWNYHVSPLPPLLWTQNINNSNNSLLNTLKDIRINQIPAAGFVKPDSTSSAGCPAIPTAATARRSAFRAMPPSGTRRRRGTSARSPTRSAT